MGGVLDREVEIPEGPGRLDLGTFEILRAAPAIHGEVRDAEGRPVAGAEVRVEGRLTAPQGTSGFGSFVTADERGRFVVEGLPPKAELTLRARSSDQGTVQPVPAVADSDTEVIVPVAPKPVIAVAGRVLGPDGTPMAGVRVTVDSQGTVQGRPSFEFPVRLLGNPTIRTGPDGTFRTPRELAREDKEYRAAVVRLPGFLPAHTSWVRPGEGDVLTLPDLVLRRRQTGRSVAGRVIDRDGQPIAGATVSQAGDGPTWTSASTDADGRFKLTGVYSGRALVFAGKEGFRFGGAIVAPEGRAVEIRLARTKEPPLARLATLPSPLSRAEERALGRALLAPVLPEARSGALGSQVGPRAILAMARLDPERVLTMLEDRVLNGQTGALIQVALARLEDDPRAAIATIEADHDPLARGQGFLALADALPVAEQDRRAEFLDRSFAEARRGTDTEAKIALLGQIADRWLDRGDLGRATPVLRAGQELIAAIPKNVYSHASEGFGEVLAVIDLPAARTLFERKGKTNVSLPDAASVRLHLGEAALRIAAYDPPLAEKLAEEGSGGPNLVDREILLFRIARRMGGVDPPRARRLLARSAERPEAPVFAQPALAPYGLGLIGSDRAATDPAEARKLLDEAFDGLFKVARDKEGRTNPPASLLMAALLPAVERVDPDRLAERLWMAASCRPARPQDLPMTDVQRDAALAMIAARYDRALADALAGPALGGLPSLLAGSNGNGFVDSRVFEVLAAYDPRSIDSLIRAMPPAARRTERANQGFLAVAPEVQARLAAAEMLGRPIEERRRTALRQSGFVF